MKLCSGCRGVRIQDDVGQRLKRKLRHISQRIQQREKGKEGKVRDRDRRGGEVM